LLQSSISHYYEYWIQRASAERSLGDIISSWQKLPTLKATATNAMRWPST